MMSSIDEPGPGTAEAVRAFYERLPYPRPVDNLDHYQGLWQDAQRRRADYHVHWPWAPYREDRAILVAGCGTSQAARHALRWPRAQVTGIDVSATSVRCTEALKQTYRLDNLQLHQLAIERVGELGMRFDQIVCTGVLHHLADPDAGLAALRGVLEPDGAMQLMVYAPYGRTGIYMLQEFCRRLGIGATEAGIRDLVAALALLPHGHPLEFLLREAPDFRYEAGLADALLHPQDRAYSVPQLFELIRTAGLRFGRWVKQAPYCAQCGVMAQLPASDRAMQLAPAEQYAVAELFRGTMVRHSAILYRTDCRANPQPVRFTGDAWLDYVPLREPDTIMVEQRLPAGAAAVLINRNHSCTDLYLPVDARQKAWFEAVDGQRAIAEIVPDPGSRDAARVLFERLWCYDQLAFDTSHAPNRS